ncbi:cardiolipin synthase [Terrimicrobium sacchariphilum]|uniref:Cardiolipin synthase n=1 Tax=Terrimicrobium sacchariphilum TaxID=690879 RepID=A0A146GBZ8_TERSA|nr:cardiolipin synthase [Terrimicrobium sacchariphilum]GAT35139.1 cardiolipin synthase [Terrimicrobium sacchariphilum]
MFELIAIIVSIVTFAFQAAGIYFAIQAVMISRTPQASIAWGLSLLVLPYIAVPLFLVFGESRFSGYVRAGTGKCKELDDFMAATREAMIPFRAHFSAKYRDAERLGEDLRHFPVTHGNRTKLLVDGKETFDAIYAAIEGAKDYVIVQFYIVHDDGVGRGLKDRLLAASARGVKCWLLYDSVGAKGLPESFVQELMDGGVPVKSFVTNRQMGRRFQVNFRNHRKLVVVDGHTAFIGGLNAGDEYMGLGPLGAWRDTHMQVEGPAVQALQVSFAEDWRYASGGQVPQIPIRPRVVGDERVLPFASGPAEVWNVSSAVICEIIHDVRERLWIASPYFVPDPALRSALAHAALRGVDVRIILPQGIDHTLPWLSSFTFYPMMREAGVRIWRYQPGFMHQKVMLADSEVAIVGSVNFDYRSFMLNFELAAAVEDSRFAKDVEKMFEADFARSIEEDLKAKFEENSFFFRLRCRLSALMSPEQ